jgi:hypothetical protein
MPEEPFQLPSLNYKRPLSRSSWSPGQHKDEDTSGLEVLENFINVEEDKLFQPVEPIWRQEAIVLGQSSAPLIFTFILQYSLTVSSVFIVGNIGKVELAAVSLASSMLPLDPLEIALF